MSCHPDPQNKSLAATYMFNSSSLRCSSCHMICIYFFATHKHAPPHCGPRQFQGKKLSRTFQQSILLVQMKKTGSRLEEKVPFLRCGQLCISLCSPSPPKAYLLLARSASHRLRSDQCGALWCRTHMCTRRFAQQVILDANTHEKSWKVWKGASELSSTLSSLGLVSKIMHFVLTSFVPACIYSTRHNPTQVSPHWFPHKMKGNRMLLGESFHNMKLSESDFSESFLDCNIWKFTWFCSEIARVLCCQLATQSSNLRSQYAIEML